MPTPARIAERLLTDTHDASLARDVLGTLDSPEGFLSVSRPGAAPRPLPREVGELLQHVLKAVASGSTVTVSTLPDEVTTSTAAAMLGISRPTLMKMVTNGDIPAHKVGTHTRLRTDDVVAARRARRQREREAFAALLDLEDDEE